MVGRKAQDARKLSSDQQQDQLTTDTQRKLRPRTTKEPENTSSQEIKIVKIGTKRKLTSATDDSTSNQIRKSSAPEQEVTSCQRKPSFRVIRKISTDLKTLVSTICCVDDHTMWIGRQAYDKLMKVEYQETGGLTIVKEFPQIDFDDFCYDKECYQILFCDRRNKSVMSISSSFEITEMKGFEPLCPTCITMTSDNFIYVGLSHAYAYDCGEPDPRQIIKMDRNGIIHQQINSLRKGKGSSYFMTTHRCTVNPVNKDLVAAGYISSKKRIVCNFSSKGKVGFSYFGWGDNSKFTPNGLTCTPRGNILVCDEYSGDIHILNKKGHCLYLITMEVSMLPEKPWSLSWDMSGHLLIGTMTGTTGNILITDYTEPDDDNI